MPLAYLGCGNLVTVPEAFFSITVNLSPASKPENLASP